MKKLICLGLCVVMLFALCACGGQTAAPAQETPAAPEPAAPAQEAPAAPEQAAPAQETPVPEPEAPAQQTPAAPEPAAQWTREGYFADENENMLCVTWMDDIDEPGWYVGIMLGELMAGGTLPQEGNALQGSLSTWEEGEEPIDVTVSEEGEDGLLLTIQGGESYHFTAYDMPEATIFVTINTEGWGMIDYAPGEEAPELDPEWPFQSAQINLAEPETYTFAAAPEAGSIFVKWTKNGEDFSTDPVIVVLLDESADFAAVFEEDPGWQNPVMNFIGEYQSGRAHALVECFGNDEAWITIEWGSSAWEFARWIIVGRLDTDTLTIAYEGCGKSVITVNDSGEESAEEVYTDGTGTIAFHDDGTFTWHEDQSEYGVDMLFEWVGAQQELFSYEHDPRENPEAMKDIVENADDEHIVNEALGFEMDYDYESFERYSDSDLECFISVYDGPGNPENFLEITHRAEDADAVAASVRAELSQEYDLLESSRELDRAGECIYIEASVLKGTNTMADELQAVYIIPASDGCFVAAEHYAIEEAEGFGHRFSYMLQTFSAIYGALTW